MRAFTFIISVILAVFLSACGGNGGSGGVGGSVGSNNAVNDSGSNPGVLTGEIVNITPVGPWGLDINGHLIRTSGSEDTVLSPVVTTSSPMYLASKAGSDIPVGRFPVYCPITRHGGCFLQTVSLTTSEVSDIWLGLEGGDGYRIPHTSTNPVVLEFPIGNHTYTSSLYRVTDYIAPGTNRVYVLYGTHAGARPVVRVEYLEFYLPDTGAITRPIVAQSLNVCTTMVHIPTCTLL